MGTLELEVPKKIYAYQTRIRMNLSFDGLAKLVRESMHKKPDSGDMYLFLNNKGEYIKILSYNKAGWVILAKRLTRGYFAKELISQKTLTVNELQTLVNAITQELPE